MKLLAIADPMVLDADGKQVLNTDGYASPVVAKADPDDKPDDTQYTVRLRCQNCGNGRGGLGKLLAVEDKGTDCDPSKETCPRCETKNLVKDV